VFRNEGKLTVLRYRPQLSFNPKPEAMAGSGMNRPHAASTIDSGFG
jgi:hypothetical protein